MSKQRIKYLRSWEFEYPTFTSGETEYHGYCIACRKDISVAHSGKKTLKQHTSQPHHKHCLQMSEGTSIAKEIELNKRKLEKLARETGFKLVHEEFKSDSRSEPKLEPWHTKPVVVEPVPEVIFICPLCFEDQSTRSKFADHMYYFHKQKDVIINRNFPSLTDFHKWKTATEKETYSYFFKNGKQLQNKNHFIQYFSCINSRLLKTKGNMVPFCPAEIKLMVDTDTNAFSIEYRPNHLGHSIDKSAKNLETMIEEVISLSDSSDRDDPMDGASADDSLDEFSELNSMLESNAKRHYDENRAIEDSFEPVAKRAKFDLSQSKEHLLNYLGNLLENFSDEQSHKKLNQILRKFEEINTKQTK